LKTEGKLEGDLSLARVVLGTRDALSPRLEKFY